MKKHPVAVAGVTDMEILGRQTARLRYDKLAEASRAIAEDLARQSAGDLERGRPQLAALLEDAAAAQAELTRKFERIFDLCKPYMREELATE